MSRDFTSLVTHPHDPAVLVDPQPELLANSSGGRGATEIGDN